MSEEASRLHFSRVAVVNMQNDLSKAKNQTKWQKLFKDSRNLNHMSAGFTGKKSTKLFAVKDFQKNEEDKKLDKSAC